MRLRKLPNLPFCLAIGICLFTTPLLAQFGLDSLHAVMDNQFVQQVFVEDLDMDGDEDVIIGGYGFNGGLTIYNNIDGNGTFEVKQFTGDSSRHFHDGSIFYAAGDIDNDGDIDLIGDQEIIDPTTPFWENDGDGNFTTTQFNEGFLSPTNIDQVQIIDSDGDGLSDIWFTDGTSIHFKKQMPGGTFQLVTIAENQAISGYFAEFALLDIDMDNDLDLIFHRRDPQNDLTERVQYEQIAPHEFTLVEALEIPQWTDGFSYSPRTGVTDFNGDGWPDLVLHYHQYDGPHNIEILQNNNGDGSFTTMQTFPEYYKMVLSDFDQDGLMDITGMKETEDGNVFAWIRNQGNFNFEEMVTEEIMYGFQLFNPDFNDDGLSDLLALSDQNIYNQFQTLIWKPGLPDLPSFGERNDISYHLADVFLLHAEDADLDNDLDLFVLNHTVPGEAKIAYFENTDGQGNFGPKQDLTSLNNESRYALFHDFNDDGIPDLLSSEIMEPGFYKLTYYASQPDFTYQSGVQLSDDYQNYSESMAILDVDGDGFEDIVSITNEPKISVLWYEPLGGGFSETTDFLPIPTAAISPQTILSFDPDQDGDDDLILGMIDKVYWAQNLDGAGTFSEWQELPASFDRYFKFQYGDIEGDGDVDLMAVGTLDGEDDRHHLTFRFDAESQHFSSAESFVPAPYTYFHHYFFADFTQDGFPDILSTNGFQTNLAPTGTFDDRQLPHPIGGSYSVSNESKIIFVDVDGDGEVELVQGQNELYWYNMDWAKAANINGRLVYDETGSCLTDESLPPVTGFQVLIEQVDGDQDQLAPTTPEGLFAAVVQENGDYLVSPILPNAYWESCPENAIVTIEGVEDIITTDFSISPTVVCPLLQMEISSGIIRPCFNSTFQIAYHNEGTAIAENAAITFTYNPGLILLSSTLSPTVLNDSTLQFELGDVGLFEEGVINLEFYVDCEIIELGDVLCFDAHITPDELCGDVDGITWDGSSLEASTFCVDEEQVAFRLFNAGTGDMSTPQTYQASIVNDDLVLFMADEVLIPSGEADTIYLPAPMVNESWLFQINQTPGHPSPVPVILQNSGCEYEDNVVENLPNMDGFVFEESLCQIVVGSYDPNNKIGLPAGVGSTHLIEKDWAVEYTINFQNTGTDTAFLVVLKDEISPLLDLSTFTPKNASHPYFWTVYERELAVTFPNILLPDSTTNEPQSKGYFTFSILPNADIVPLSQIENEANIYFDFNDPIVTNTTLHTIIKPIHASMQNAEICPGEMVLGQQIFADTLLQEWWFGSEYDSVTWTHVEVLEAPETTVFVELDMPGIWENIPISADTTILQTFTAASGCDSLVQYQISILTDVDHPLWELGLRIEPNPASDFIYLQWQPEQGALKEASIYNMTGQLRKRFEIPVGANSDQLLIADLPAGMYLLQLSDGYERHHWLFNKM